MKQQLLKEKLKNQTSEASRDKKKSGIYTVKEEENETDEIKTEMYLSSNESDSSSDDESPSSGQHRSRKGSRK